MSITSVIELLATRVVFPAPPETPISLTLPGNTHGADTLIPPAGSKIIVGGKLLGTPEKGLPVQFIGPGGLPLAVVYIPRASITAPAEG